MFTLTLLPGIFTISSSYNLENAAIEIYNVLGDKIYSGHINNSNQKEIHLNKALDGIYFIKVSDEERNYSGKIIIEKN